MVRYLLGSSRSADESAGTVPLPQAEGAAQLARARAIAETILEAFDRHFRIFREVTQQARRHFVDGDWAAAREASARRISLYDKRVREAIALLRERYALHEADHGLWQEIKFQYLGLLYGHRQPELAETFYNSVFVGLFHRRYYNNDHIFVRPAVSTERIEGESPAYRSYYPTQEGWTVVLDRLLRDIDVGLPYENRRRDLCHLLRAVERLPMPSAGLTGHFQVQVLRSIFYRNKAAYVVGRVINGNERYPFVLPLLRTDDGRVRVDALVTESDDVANVFSFARAYFMADCEVPSAVVRFLLSCLPGKSAADLYTAIGFHKQGKAEFYRDFLDHLRNSSDCLRIAPGIEGMVMLVFTLPSYPYVFKVIRDRFPSVKRITEAEVVAKYRFVKRQDRVGRMADTWEFSHAAFPVDRFDPALLQELLQAAPSKVCIEGEQVVIRHLFIERRLNPLNLFLEQADDDALRRAMCEYGNALREIAGAGIFPGDLLLKNFGVTRHGRVIFYDYDEIVPIEVCRFRHIPEPQTPEQEMAAEPWYSVAENDVFPEEFGTFLMTDPRWRSAFLEAHADLLRPETWQAIQAAVAAGQVPDVYPYRSETRFAPELSGSRGGGVAPSSESSNAFPSEGASQE